MNCKNIIFLVLFSSFIALYAKEQELLFFSPVIYQPVIALALQDGKISASFGKILKGDALNSISGKICISKMPPEGQNQKASQYEAVYALSFSNVSDVKFILYEKNNCIMKVDKITGDKTESFLRLIRFDEQKSLPEDYRKKTIDTLFKVYSMEDYILDIYKNAPDKDIGFEVVDCRKSDATIIAAIKFPDYSLVKAFSTQKDQITNSAWLIVKKGQPVLISSVSVHMDNYITEAALRGKDGTGFDCHFFRSSGLKDYVPVKKNVLGKQIVWKEDGKVFGEYTYPPGYIPPPEKKPTENDPARWLTALPDIKSMRRQETSFKINGKSPYYKFTLSSTSENKYTVDFLFSDDKKSLEDAFEKIKDKIISAYKQENCKDNLYQGKKSLVAFSGKGIIEAVVLYEKLLITFKPVGNSTESATKMLNDIITTFEASDNAKNIMKKAEDNTPNSDETQ